MMKIKPAPSGAGEVLTPPSMEMLAGVNCPESRDRFKYTSAASSAPGTPLQVSAHTQGWLCWGLSLGDAKVEAWTGLILSQTAALEAGGEASQGPGEPEPYSLLDKEEQLWDGLPLATRDKSGICPGASPRMPTGHHVGQRGQKAVFLRALDLACTTRRGHKADRYLPLTPAPAVAPTPHMGI